MSSRALPGMMMPRAFKLAQGIENFDALPRRPDNLNFGPEVEDLDGRTVVGVIGDLAGDSPRRVAIHRHFFNVRRKATPSNLPLPPPTARASAISRVICGRGLAAGLRFDLRATVFIGAELCCG